MPEERLQKILARAGFGSRRANEELISAGRVRVNGQLATLGMKADPQQDQITVDGRAIPAVETPVYVALYKPRGVLSTVSADDPRKTVRELVQVEGHLFPVGRLDVDSEGLVLMTNDGELANRLTHPRYEHEKEYRVLVARHPDDQQVETWRRGVVLDDGYKTAPAQVEKAATAGKGAWLRVVLREGRKRQIRETGRLLGLPVVRIIRIRIGSLLLGNMKPGEWRYLTEKEVSDLRLGKPPVGRPRRPRISSRSESRGEKSQGRRKSGALKEGEGKVRRGSRSEIGKREAAATPSRKRKPEGSARNRPATGHRMAKPTQEPGRDSPAKRASRKPGRNPTANQTPRRKKRNDTE